MIRLALLLALAYAVALPLWDAAIQHEPNPWASAGFVVDLLLMAGLSRALVRRVLRLAR